VHEVYCSMTEAHIGTGMAVPVTSSGKLRSRRGGRDQILLYTSPACFNIAPKRALCKEDLIEVLPLLKQRIPPEN
jgi:hypothetical protein